MLTPADRLQRPSERARLNDVVAWIDGWAAPVAAEDVLLAHAVGRVLARSVEAPLDLPPFDRAAADGFALRADETVGASAYNPLPFRLGPASAGVAPGVAVAVASGDPLPAGADAVIRLEHAMPEPPGAMAAIAPVFAGSSVERKGSHAVRGSVLLASGRRLDASNVGLLAAAGLARVSVMGMPRVRCVLLAGRAIEAGRAPAAGEIYDANGPMLAALVGRDGGVVAGRHRVERDEKALGEALRHALEAPEADIVLVAGGTGPGADDHAAAALAQAGALAVHGVAVRPGETAGAGRAAGMPVFLLPGVPVDCLWAYELIAGRAIRLMAGRSPELPYAVETLRLARKIVSEVGTVEVCPVRRTGGAEAEPMPSFGEAGLAAAAHADGFVLVPEASEGHPQGAAVIVYLRR
ncbi:MAG: molybdopterin-binding protein [Hyphomicrobiaceae bacterium]